MTSKTEDAGERMVRLLTRRQDYRKAVTGLRDLCALTCKSMNAIAQRAMGTGYDPKVTIETSACAFANRRTGAMLCEAFWSIELAGTPLATFTCSANGGEFVCTASTGAVGKTLLCKATGWLVKGGDDQGQAQDAETGIALVLLAAIEERLAAYGEN